MTTRIITGDARTAMADIPDGSIQCTVTSPPYFGLRSYLPDGHDGKHAELGSEPTLAAYVANLVAVFREVKRVLRDDGTLWLNLGDSYAANWNSQRAEGGGGFKDVERKRITRTPGFKPKDLMMVPARVALALQDDGWYLRSDIIWHKKAPMPESVTDRPTSAHEHIFLLTKRARYFYDADAVREENVTSLPVVSKPRSQNRNPIASDLGSRPRDQWGSLGYHPAARNQRNVCLLYTSPSPRDS